MVSSPSRTVQTLIAVLTLLKMLTFVPFAVRSLVSYPFSTLFSLFGVITILYFVFGSIGVLGLLRDWPRAFTAYYAYGFVATFGMGSFVTLFPTGLSGSNVTFVTAVLIVYNLTICLLVAGLQVRALRARDGPS